MTRNMTQNRVQKNTLGTHSEGTQKGFRLSRPIGKYTTL